MQLQSMSTCALAADLLAQLHPVVSARINRQCCNDVTHLLGPRHHRQLLLLLPLLHQQRTRLASWRVAAAPVLC